MIELTCPGCSRTLHLPEGMLGRKVRCRHCSARIDTGLSTPPKRRGMPWKKLLWLPCVLLPVALIAVGVFAFVRRASRTGRLAETPASQSGQARLAAGGQALAQASSPSSAKSDVAVTRWEMLDSLALESGALPPSIPGVAPTAPLASMLNPRTVRPVAGRKLLCVGVNIAKTDGLPQTLDLHAIQAKDASGQQYPLVAFGLGGARSLPPSADHVISTAGLAGDCRDLLVSLAGEGMCLGMNIGKVGITLDHRTAQARLRLIEIPTTLQLFFVVPPSAKDVAVSGVFGHSLTAAKLTAPEQAKAAPTLGNMRQIFLALSMCAAENGGQWPEDLQTLVQKGYCKASDLKNPARPELDVGYVYIRPFGVTSDNTIILYERHDAWPANGVAVCRKGGPMDTVKDQAEFKGLVESGAPSREAAEKGALLLEAVRQGKKDDAARLLEEGAYLNARDNWGATPLHEAAARGHTAIVELLIARSADVNVRKTHDGATPLHEAVWDGHKAVVELLVAKGADVNARDTAYGQTPLHNASMNADIFEFLVAHGADVNAQDVFGKTPSKPQPERMVPLGRIKDDGSFRVPDFNVPGPRRK